MLAAGDFGPVTGWQRLAIGRRPARTAVRAAILVASAVILLRFVLLPVRTEGGSMLPTYTSGQFTLVNRLAYAAAAPSRGDVVAIRLAGPSVVFIKRIVGLPGERVRILRGTLYVNGRPVPEPYVVRPALWTLPEVVLAPDEYFVVGDNRSLSLYRTDLGTVKRDRFVGKLLF